MSRQHIHPGQAAAAMRGVARMANLQADFIRAAASRRGGSRQMPAMTTAGVKVELYVAADGAVHCTIYPDGGPVPPWLRGDHSDAWPPLRITVSGTEIYDESHTARVNGDVMNRLGGPVPYPLPAEDVDWPAKYWKANLRARWNGIGDGGYGSNVGPLERHDPAAPTYPGFTVAGVGAFVYVDSGGTLVVSLDFGEDGELPRWLTRKDDTVPLLVRIGEQRVLDDTDAARAAGVVFDPTRRARPA